MTPPCTPAPNTKSDTQWLHELGYLNGLQDFMSDYGFADDEQDRLDALSLFRQFRNEQQEAWEKIHKAKPTSLAESRISFTAHLTSLSYTEISPSKNRLRKNSCGGGKE